MSYADLLKSFAVPTVTPVTHSSGSEVTKKSLVNQSSNPSYPSYPEKPTRSANKTKTAKADALLLEIALTLEFSLTRLRALLSDDRPEPARSPENRPRHVDLMKAWKPAHDALINHLMACPTCYAPLSRYCPEGSGLRQAYVGACPSIAPPRIRNPSIHNRRR
ncbi:MAG: hypothetical protein ABJ331_20470 [Marinobacter sp.]|uniref:hypothetical protein n=1 Tax=Marinobacter sp. TaxID=50741 RepID=UPI003297C727